MASTKVDWSGKEAVCVASGPSLTPEDCERVRVWRQAAENRVVIVCNTCFRLCPWADVLFAMDDKWWRAHSEEVNKVFHGKCHAHAGNGKLHGFTIVEKDFKNFGNSGAGCVSVAIHRGVKRVVMIGYDCQRTGNKSHWHGDHPKGMGNAASIPAWPRQFKMLWSYAKMNGCKVINATRESALKDFTRMDLETALA